MKDKIKVPEILAPAGSMESLKAAVAAGCDAIYIGGSRFGARAYADNPEKDEMLSAIEYCHLHGVKIYMTVNTLLKDREMDELYPFLKPYYEAGLDAVIVQDIGVLKNIHEWFPDIEIHASTQMTLTMGVSDKLLKKYGVTRMVPARELSMEELVQMRKDTSLEMEVFVHGALCYCYSGQCLFSSMLGGRSGNRGRCAQPCRQQYLVDGKKCGIGEYVLSPMELSNLPYIAEMIECGIDSFKIEGRMKRPEYTAFVTAMFRKYTDLYVELGKDGYRDYIKTNRAEFENDICHLKEIYNRGGFTQGYLEGRSGVPFEKKKYDSGVMLSAKRPKHGGVLVGKVISVGKGSLRYKLDKDIYPQDVVEFCDKNMRQEYEYTVGTHLKAGMQVEARFKKGSRIFAGDEVYRTKKAVLLDDIREKYIDKEKKVIITGKFEAHTGENAVLQVILEDIVYSVSGDVCQNALKNPADEKSVKKSIMQTGNTEFEFSTLDVTMDDGLFIPVGMLKKMRREALDGLEKKILEKHRRSVMPCDEGEKVKEYLTGEPEKDLGKTTEYIVSVMNMEQLSAVLDFKDKNITKIYLRTEILDDNEINHAIDEIHKNKKKAFIVMPQIFRKNVWERESAVLTGKDSSYLEKCDGFVIKNFEEYTFLTEKCMISSEKIVCDAQMYVMNKSAYDFWKENGITKFTMPFELTEYEMDGIAKKAGCEFILYTHIPLMVSAQCVRYNTKKCAFSEKKGINEKIILTDRKSREFMAINYCKYCYNIIYQKTPLYLKEYEDKLKDKGISKFRYDFTFESIEEVKTVLSGKYNGIYDEGHITNGVE